MMFRRSAVTPLLSLALLFLLAIPAFACVGKTVVIGTAGHPQQAMAAEILSLLISERTGTTVKIADFSDTATAHDALLKAEIDMYVEYTGVGQVEVLHAEPITDRDALFSSVKESYNQQLNLIWLKPLGFSAPDRTEGSLPAEAATVVRKDTLKKFPALQRLLDKLGGQIDDATIASLVEKAKETQPRIVAKEFLKEKRFI